MERSQRFWNPYLAGIALGIVLLLSFLVAGKGLGASGAAYHLGVAGLETVALSGGVFQNRLLVEKTKYLLESDGFTVLTHARVPPNDGGLALGQAVIAAHQVMKAREGSHA